MPEPDHLHEPDDPNGSAELLELEKIPRPLWEQTLAPLHPQLRFFVTLRIEDPVVREQAQTLAADLNMADRIARVERDKARGRARRGSAPLPSPDAAHPTLQPTVQVSLRLRCDDYALLRDAAEAVGMKPTTLARALVLNGARKMLDERGAT